MLVEDVAVAPIKLTMVAAVIVSIIMFLLALTVAFQIFRPWNRARNMGVDVNLFEIISMKFRRSNINLLLDVSLAYQQQGNPQTLKDLENFYFVNRQQFVDAETFMAMYDRHNSKRL